MQNDTISRSALVAELEAFKMSLGDVVLGFVVDRVIERVKAQPGVSRPVEISVKQVPDSGKVLMRRGLTWFHDFSDPATLAAEIEKLLLEGWSPCKWHYETATATDHRCFGFLFERELR